MAQVITRPLPGTAIGTGFFSRHLPSRDQLLRSEAVWLVLVAFIVIAKILSDTVVPITFRAAGQESIFSWTYVLTLGLLGLLGIWCARATGFRPPGTR